ncbi:MAG: hypothetical protein MUF38_05735 [Anaerolineae bacterium]|jgi:hypothetical protein|nr:hypothetical protein [Anaerolineae bacterium]
MTDYAVLVDWDNNGYWAFDARPGDAPNLLGRGAANFTDKVLHSTSTDRISSITFDSFRSSADLITTGGFKDRGLHQVFWNTSTLGHKLYLCRKFINYLDIDTQTDEYSLVLPAGSYRFGYKVRARVQTPASTTTSITGLRMQVFGSVSGALGTLTLGTVTTAWATYSQTFSVPSEQTVWFEMDKTGTIDLFLDLSEPFLLAGTGAIPTAFNCGTPSLSENLTPDVMEMRWGVGFREAYRYVGDDNRLRCTMTNGAKTYSPDNPASPLYKSYMLGPMQIRVMVNANNAGWTTQYTGYIDSIMPQTMLNGDKTATIEARSVRRLIEKQELETELYENVSAVDLLGEVLNFTDLIQSAPFLQKPALVAMMGSTSSGTTYKLAGDQWQARARALDAAQDILQADFGKMWVNADGNVEYFLRLDYDAVLAAPMPTLDDTDLVGAEYAVMAAGANVVSAYSYPRKVSASAVLLWELDEPFDLQPGEVVELAVRYIVPDNERTIGGKDTSVTTFTAPAAVTYVWNGTDPRGGTLTITNTAGIVRTVSAIQVSGKRITWFNAIRQRVRDADAVALFGRQSDVIENRLVDKRTVARELAQYAVGEFGVARSAMSSVRLLAKTEAKRAQYAAYKPGSFIRVSEGQTGHEGAYMVVGVDHEVSDGMKLHRQTIHLEPVRRFVVLDDPQNGVLDGGAYLG